MPNPKILVLTSTFPANSNSIDPRFVFDLSKSLDKNFEMCVLTQHRPGTLDRESVGSMSIIRYRYGPESIELLSENGGIANSLQSNPLLYLVLPFFLLSQIFACARLIRSFKPEIIHAHWIIPQGLCVTLALFFVRDKPKLLITSHGGDLYGFKGKLFRRLKKWVVNRSDKFCVVSKSMREYASKEFSLRQDSIPVLPMGAELDTRFVLENSIIRRKGQLIFVGRLVEKKGLIYLLKAMATIDLVSSKLHLIIVGTGPEKENLQFACESLGIKDAVSFLGSKNHSEIALLLQQSELAVFPFTQAASGDMEGLGLVVIEAMGCMCPVVVGNVPAIHDTVSDKKTGFIIDPTDTLEFAELISNLHSRSELREQIAISGYNFARENYSWSKCSENYRQVFMDLID